jgi:acetolactate synthase regulatory subunit
VVTTQLLVGFTPAEGAIVRILGLIERRGFTLRDVAVRSRDEAGSLTVVLEPRDEARQLHVLSRQLSRLIDVTSASVCSEEQDGSLAARAVDASTRADSCVRTAG